MTYLETDGMRGPVGGDRINPEVVFQLGLAVGTAAMESTDQALVPVSGDPRESSPWIENALSAGITAAGANALRLATLPTPALIYLTNWLSMEQGGHDVPFGAMVTASHNLYLDNGVKIVGPEGKLSEARHDDLENRIGHSLPAAGPPGRQYTDHHLRQKYEDFLVSHGGSEDFSDLRIAIDTANGAASGIAEQIFTRLGAEVTPLFDQPDGRNINAGCGATHPETLQEVVRSKGYDMGIALDGDADRLHMVDGKGRLLNGDHLLYALATTDPDTRHKAVVATIMSNMGLEVALKKRGIALHRTPVGDRFVLEHMKASGVTVGGEQSGHIFTGFLGDGMLAAIRIIKQLREADKTLDQIYDEVPMFPQKDIQLIAFDKQAVMDDPGVQALIEEYREKLGEKGRLVLRPSGTEAVIRAMVEARDLEVVESSLADIRGRLGRLIADVQTRQLAVRGD